MVVRGPATDPLRSITLGGRDEVSAVIREALDKLVNIDVYWLWSSRFTRRIGDADLKTNVLRFSRPLWPKASVAERRETIIHEVCHLAAFELFGEVADRRPHGKEWRKTMLWAGYPNASRCHDISRIGVAQVARAFCGCRTMEISLTQARKHVSGEVILKCTACDTRFVVAAEDL